MKRRILFSIFLVLPLFSAEYMSNRSCRECHPDIYDEYQSSYHARTWFNDTLHRKVAQKIPVYDCGRCHMPAAKDLEEMAEGKERPDPASVRQKDAVSCFYCHEIAYVKEAHRFNENVLAKQASGYKPSLYGSLKDPDPNDKHSSVHSPIYDRYACMGCHGHKRNGQDVLIFEAMKKGEGSQACIKCHMPSVQGPPEKMNKRARTTHKSHTFSGIHDAAMRAKSVEIRIAPKKRGVDVTLENRMGHPLIIQPARMKYLQLEVIRDGQVIWRNFEKSPTEDRQGCFRVDFVGPDGKEAPIPYFATARGFVNNLGAKEKRILHYKTPSLRKNDRIVARMFVQLAKPSCAAAIHLEKGDLTEPLLMKRVETVVH